jgi:hypothetical protein
MNCRRIEELIPLYVGGDLDSDKAGAVASHTLTCAGCNEMVAEYEESQRWLRTYTPPRFDDASLNDMKLSVLREIKGRKSQVTFLNSLAACWTRRLALATSAAFLIIFAALAFYVYQNKAGVASDGNNMAAGGGAAQEKQSPEIAPVPENSPGLEAAKLAPGATFIRRHRRRLAGSARRGTVARSLKNKEPLAEPPDMKAVRQAVAGETKDTLTSERATSPGVLRIEIQTSDPSIRIIWFSPKETEAHHTKPITETD